MQNVVQAKIDRLKELLGDDFPDPLPPISPSEGLANDTQPSNTVRNNQADVKEFFDVTGTNSDSDTASQKQHQMKTPSQKKPPRKRNPSRNPQQNIHPWRANPHLLNFNPSHEHIGKLAPNHQAFCPILAVSKYPYKFVSSQISEHIAQKFFNDGKFWYRAWDVYYVWPPVSLTPKPMLLIPVEQVEQLLAEIYLAFDKDEEYYLTLGEEAKDFGLVLEFPSHPDLRPRVLGHSETRETFASMERCVPRPDFRPIAESKPTKSVESATLDEWMRMMAAALEVSKGRNKAAKASKKEQQIQKKRHWQSELRYAERLLGLRLGSFPLEEPGQDASWEKFQAYHAAKTNHRELKAINPNQPPPYEFESQPIFLSVDVECYERDKSKVTEIGIGMLDTADLVGLAPGNHGTNWHDKITARHFRVREHAELLNGYFVSDAADKFQFPKGGSEFINLKDAATTIASCFHPPYCNVKRPWLRQEEQSDDEEPSENKSDNGGIQIDRESVDVEHVTALSFTQVEELTPSSNLEKSSRTPRNADHEASAAERDERPTNQTVDLETSDKRSSSASEIHSDPPLATRNIVLVGHDIDQDIRYLRWLDFDLTDLDTITTLDTASLYRAHEREWNPKSLGGLLLDYQLIGWHPHNAGNDAVHTLWVMIALVLQHTMERGDEKAKKRREERQKQREEEAVVRAGLQAREQAEGWGSEEEWP